MTKRLKTAASASSLPGSTPVPSLPRTLPLYGLPGVASNDEGDDDAPVVLSVCPSPVARSIVEATKEGQYIVTRGKVLRVEHGAAFEVVDVRLREGLASWRDRVTAMCGLRDQLRALLADQVDPTVPESLVEDRRRVLDLTYDHFVARFGPVHAEVNQDAFEADPDLPLLLSLEIFDEATVHPAKAEIFSTRTAWARIDPPKCKDPVQALVRSLDQCGRIDRSVMARFLGGDVDDLMDQLWEQGIVFRNPRSQRWERADEYLSGNVRDKLVHAVMLAAMDAKFARNVRALQAVQPKDLTLADVHIKLGAPWVPADLVEGFIQHLLKSPDPVATVVHLKERGTWALEPAEGWKLARLGTPATVVFGTARMNALDLIEAALNMRSVKVLGADETVDAKATELARERTDKIQEAFRQYVWKSPEASRRVLAIYNAQYNSVVPRQFDGSHLTLPGSNAAIQFRPAQKNGVWRIVQEGCALLGHPVGGGKTMILAAAAMEMKRLGLAHKPMHVVQNHMLMSYAGEFLRLYPAANLLVARPIDLTRAGRRKFAAKVATGNWDSVIIGQSSFERIEVSPATQRRMLEQRLIDLRRIESDLGQKKRLGRARASLTREIEQINDELAALNGRRSVDAGITFEELGVDALFVDEAHTYKNLGIKTKMTGVSGLPTGESRRAADLYAKIRSLHFRRGKDTGVVFATATPISNSLAELFTMQRYLQPAALDEMGCPHFDGWAASFAEPVEAMEIAPDGSGYRPKTRLAKFRNLPELITTFRVRADIIDDAQAGICRPALETGAPIVVACAPSARLVKYIDGLVERSEKIRKQRVKPTEDNMLCVTNDGRMAALDIRLVVPDAAFEPDSKIGKAAQIISAIWKETAQARLTQLVFCDLSTPKRGFNVYDDLKQRLIDAGVSAEEIAFVHDFPGDKAKADLFAAVREGRIRVLFGSTEKLGTGTNVQTRLYAVHHLDSPWRPSDVEQRDGRILRPGNMNPMVRCYRYVTERSFDAYIWQAVEAKSRFIGQVMRGDLTVREAEDVDERALSYAEVKAIATGNPLVKKKAEVDARIAKLVLLSKAFVQQRSQIDAELMWLVDRKDQAMARASRLQADHDRVIDTRADKFTMTLRGRLYTERVDAAEALDTLAREIAKKYRGANRRQEEVVGKLAGFELVVSVWDMSTHSSINWMLRGDQVYEGNGDTPYARLRSMERAVQSIAGDLEEARQRIAQYEERLAALKQELVGEFSFEDELSALYLEQASLARQLTVVD